MQVDVKEFLKNSDIQEKLYPGKRIVKPCKQIGDYKNHCVVVDWRDPETISVAIKPGLTGQQLAPEMVRKYPVCFQMPTEIKIKVLNDNQQVEDEDEEGSSKGKSSGGGGGKKLAKKRDADLISARFGESAEGSIPNLGEIKEMMVMGVEIAKDAFDTAFTEITKQIKHAKISATEVLSKAANLVTRVAPPSFLEPKGDEVITYQYDREKNADIGSSSPSFG